MSKGQKISIVLGSFFLFLIIVALASGGSSTVKQVEESEETPGVQETETSAVKESEKETDSPTQSTVSALEETPPPIIEQPEPARMPEETTPKPVIEEVQPEPEPIIKTPEPELLPIETSDDYVQIGSYRLLLESESEAAYDRSQYGNHKSDICKSATIDPYTNLVITSCDVDHVVALAEANESGAWEWDTAQKKMFSQDSMNYLATLACVNRSKGARDIAEWSDVWITRSQACGGGYTVTSEGRCLLATITLKVKSKWNLSVDKDEAEALKRCT